MLCKYKLFFWPNNLDERTSPIAGIIIFKDILYVPYYSIDKWKIYLVLKGRNNRNNIDGRTCAIMLTYLLFDIFYIAHERCII